MKFILIGFQLWALGVIEALLTTGQEDSQSMSWVLDVKEPLVVSLISPICEGDFLCEGAFKVLEAALNLIGGHLRPDTLVPLIRGILAKKDQILTHARLVSFFGFT